MQTLMHWFKCSSAFDLLVLSQLRRWEDRKIYSDISEKLFHRHIRRLEHVALSAPARAWQCNISLGMETSAALWAGAGAARRGNCVHQREQTEAGARRAEWLCRMQSWKLPEQITAAGTQHRLQDAGRASAATGGTNLHLPHFGVRKQNCA